MKPFLTPDQVAALESGAAGALLTLLFGDDITPFRALLVFTSGGLAAFYGAHPLAQWSGLNEGVLGFMMGMLGFWLMSFIVKSAQAAIANPGAVWERIVRLLPWFKGEQK